MRDEHIAGHSFILHPSAFILHLNGFITIPVASFG